MKKSLVTPQLYPTPPPPTRREVMKKGLGLTLGSSALGLATLGAPTTAQAWGPWHNDYYWNVYQSYSFWIYLDALLTSSGFFRGLGWRDIHIKWRNSNDAMWKDGYVYINDSRGNIATYHFNFNQFYNRQYNEKDLYWQTMAIGLDGQSPLPITVNEDATQRELQELDSENTAVANWLNNVFKLDPAHLDIAGVLFTVQNYVNLLASRGYRIVRNHNGGAYLGGKKVEYWITKGQEVTGLTVIWGYYFGKWTGVFIGKMAVTMNGAINDINGGLVFAPAMVGFGISTMGALSAMLGSGWFSYLTNHQDNTSHQDTFAVSAAVALVFLPVGIAATCYAIHSAARMRISSGLQALIVQNQLNGGDNFKVLG